VLARARATADLARTSGGWVNASRRYSPARAEPSRPPLAVLPLAGPA